MSVSTRKALIGQAMNTSGTSVSVFPLKTMAGCMCRAIINVLLRYCCCNAASARGRVSQDNTPSNMPGLSRRSFSLTSVYSGPLQMVKKMKDCLQREYNILIHLIYQISILYIYRYTTYIYPIYVIYKTYYIFYLYDIYIIYSDNNVSEYPLIWPKQTRRKGKPCAIMEMG